MNFLRNTGAIVLACVLAQSNSTCQGQNTDLLYEGGATGNFSSTGDWAMGFNPSFQFNSDSLTFGATPAGGATVNNDLDPANNGGEAYSAGLGSTPDGMGTGNRDNSASFHFLDGSGNFTITGFPVQTTSANNNASLVRIEADAGLVQTIDNDLILTRDNQGTRLISVNPDARLVLNGDITYGPTGAAQWLFGDNAQDSPTTVEFNGVGDFSVQGGANQGSSAWASGANVIFPGMRRAQIVRVNAGDLQRDTIEGGNGSHLIFGNSQALGRAHTGSWETNDLDYVFISSTRIERFNDGYADNNTFSVKEGVDLSEYGIQTVFGSNWNFRSDFDTSIGFISAVLGT